MKNKLGIIFGSILTLVLVMSFFSAAFAEGGLSSIQSSEDENAMFSAMIETEELSSEAEMLNLLSEDMRAAVLGSVFRRRNHVTTMEEFKQMFSEQYDRKTAVMNWSAGYPYVKEIGDNGATVSVKTDIDGWVYIIVLSDDIAGGLSDEYSFMKFYNEDNGAFKQETWVQGGSATDIGLSCGTWANGKDYRVYYMLRTAGNESGFGRIDYTLPKFWYRYNLVRSEMKYHVDGDFYYYDYDLYLTSSHELDYETYHFGPFIPGYLHWYNNYTTPNQTQLIDWEYVADYEYVIFVDTKITTPGGSEYIDFFDLYGPIP